MVKYEDVYNDLKGRTGTDFEVEKELCKRIAIIEDKREIVPKLSKDWIATWVLMVVCGAFPIIIEAFRLGVH